MRCVVCRVSCVGAGTSLVDGVNTINQKARDLIERHLNSHSTDLKALPQQMQRDRTKYGTTLESLLLVGRADTGLKHGDAIHVWGEYMRELVRLQR